MQSFNIEFQGLSRLQSGVFTNITHEHLDYHKTLLNTACKNEDFQPLSKIVLPYQIETIKTEVRVKVLLGKKLKQTNGIMHLKLMLDFKTKIIESNFTGLSLKNG